MLLFDIGLSIAGYPCWAMCCDAQVIGIIFFFYSPYVVWIFAIHIHSKCLTQLPLPWGDVFTIMRRCGLLEALHYRWRTATASTSIKLLTNWHTVATLGEKGKAVEGSLTPWHMSKVWRGKMWGSDKELGDVIKIKDMLIYSSD